MKVSAPFHCSLMKDASIIMKETLKFLKLNKLKSKFISNVTANFENDPEIIKELLIKQVFRKPDGEKVLLNPHKG